MHLYSPACLLVPRNIRASLVIHPDLKIKTPVALLRLQEHTARSLFTDMTANSDNGCTLVPSLNPTS
jgi:hypothetical protein